MQERRQHAGDMMELLRDIRTTQLEQAEKHGKMRGDIDAVDARISSVEKSNTRHWWVTVAIAPLLGLIHGIARKMGVQF